MLKSMTGFGRAEQTVHEKTFLVEIKSLNGKQYELQLKLPPLLRPYEFEIRNRITGQPLFGNGAIDFFFVRFWVIFYLFCLSTQTLPIMFFVNQLQWNVIKI